MKVITITGTCHYHGQDFITPGMTVQLIKDPDNEHDREAIRAELKGLGKIGYVANSPQTVLGESMSAGRLYDKIGDKAKATVLYVLPRGILCRVRGLSPETPLVADGDDADDVDEADDAEDADDAGDGEDD